MSPTAPSVPTFHSTLHVDVAIVGAGTAGMSAYRAAVAAGARTLLIEGAHYGTTCARVGCMPSKLLVAAADAARGVDRAPIFGISGGQSIIDGARVMERVRAERDRFVGFVTRSVDGFPQADRLWGKLASSRMTPSRCAMGLPRSQPWFMPAPW